MSKTRISRDDLEAKLSALQTGFETKVLDRKNTIMMVGAGVGLAVVILFFLLGKRRGTKKTTIVEIRRI